MFSESFFGKCFREKLFPKTAIKSKNVVVYGVFRHRGRQKNLVSTRYNEIFSVSGGGERLQDFALRGVVRLQGLRRKAITGIPLLDPKRGPKVIYFDIMKNTKVARSYLMDDLDIKSPSQDENGRFGVRMTSDAPNTDPTALQEPKSA